MTSPKDKTLNDVRSGRENVVSLRCNPELEKGIKAITYTDLISTEPQPLQYVLTPWLPVQGIAFVYAATGVGKTLFTLNVAYCIAGGGNFLKYKAPESRKVLYIDGEMSYAQVHTRFAQTVNQQGPLDYPENFCLLTPDKVAPFTLPKICTPEGQDFYNRFIDRENIQVIVFDNLSMLSAIDENNSEQWKIVQDWLIYLRSHGRTIVMVHHAGKDKRGYRGSSRMLDCADTAISLQNMTDNSFENEITNTTSFKIVYQKSRTFAGVDALPFDVSLTPLGWTYESNEKNNFIRIVEMYELGIKPNDIASELGINRSYIYKVLKKARFTGLIKA